MYMWLPLPPDPTIKPSDEGTQDHFFIKIHSEPNADKTVTLTPVITGDENLNIGIRPASLTIDESNWNRYHRINITSVKDNGDVKETVGSCSSHV